MVDHIVHTSEPRGRVGARSRRRRREDVKGRIVAESFLPGAVASEVARRHGLSPQHLSAWRKAARAGLLRLPAEAVPAVTGLCRGGTPPGGGAEGARGAPGRRA